MFVVGTMSVLDLNKNSFARGANHLNGYFSFKNVGHKRTTNMMILYIYIF